MATGKDPAAVSLGRKGGKAYREKHTPEERSESARNAVRARWANKTEAERKAIGKKLAEARKKAKRAKKKTKP